MQSVLRLATINGRQVIDRTDDATELLREVRLAVYKLDHRQLAKEIGVSPGTIMSFRSGRTVWPRPNTLFAILNATGFAVRIVRVVDN